MRIIIVSILLVILGLSTYLIFPENKLPLNSAIDSLLVLKSRRQLWVFSEGKVLKIFRISLGRNPVGNKEYEGDKRTPEGLYEINDKNPESGYYKNLGISYPNEKDMKRLNGSERALGKDIKIHGLRNGLGFIGKFQRWFDWTAGCIALTNQEMDELYRSVKVGTPIQINP